MTAGSGLTVDLAGLREPVALGDPATAWRVLSGRAEVFAVELGAGGWSEVGQRERLGLFTAGAGDLVLPLPGGHGVGLLLVGLVEGTGAAPVPVAELQAAAFDGDADTVAAIEGWLEAATAALSGRHPTGGVSLLAGDEAEIAGAQPAWPATRIVWLATDGRLSPFAAPPEDVVADDAPAGEAAPVPAVVLPVPSNAWVLNTGGPWRAVPSSGKDALAREAGWKGLAVFAGALADRTAAVLRDRSESSTARRRARARYEESLTADTYAALAGVLQRDRVPTAATGEGGALLVAFTLVAESLGVAASALDPRLLRDASDPVDALSRASGLRSRPVTLEHGWWKRDCGPLLVRREEGGYAAAVPTGPNRYRLSDPAMGVSRRVDDAAAAALAPEAVVFYRPLPVEGLDGWRLLRHLVRPLRGDLRYLALFSLLTGLLSLVTPLVTKTIFSSVVPGLERNELWWLLGLMVAVAVSSFGIGAAQQLGMLRIEGRSSTDLQAGLWDRLLDLPLPFFRRFTAGDLTMRVMGVEQVRSLATTTVTTAMLAVSVGLANLVLAFVLQPRLALFGLCAIAIGITVMVGVARYQIRHQRRVLAETRSLFQTAMELIGAVGKLRVADADIRGFARWATHLGSLKSSFYDAQLGFVAVTTFTAAATSIATAFVFLGAATLPAGAITAATFIAFNTAFGQTIHAVTNLSSVATFLAQAVPAYDNMRPILEMRRETDELRPDPGELRGAIDVSHVSLRYGADLPLVLEDVSLGAAPGEMVAIVGPSGSGKTSLMRVLLGFEIPEIGSVRIDGMELDSLDLRAVRRQTGVVLQSARLIAGDIFANIVGTRPLTLDDAWEAARIAGIDKDIEAMPMGMHTFVAEGGSTISGGQRQRLLIARAVAGRPRILLFDEATSALDNRTQAQVADAIARLRATRLVIAHRLSTVASADRVAVIAGGRLVQEGGYEELLSAEGPFRDLARRQLLA